MKILHIDTERTWRGGQQQVLSLIEGLASRGHENHAVVYKGGALADKLRGICPLLEIRPFGEWDFVAAHFVNRKIKRDHIDIIHAHSGHAVALAAFSRLGTKIPFVLTRRVDFPVGRNFLSRLKYRSAAGVASISTGVKNVLLQSGIDSQKIFLIPSGVDFKKFKNVHPVHKEAFGFPRGTAIIGQVAALAPHKDQRTFIEAISLLRAEGVAVGGVIVGEGPSRHTVEEKISDLKLEPYFKLLGYKENPLDYLSSFDVFCLSSKEEGLGTSVIDAMALSIPVVATQVGGVPDLIENEITGFLCPPQNSVLLAECLRRALEGGKQGEIRRNAAQKAQNFDVFRTVEQTEAMYRVICPQSFPHN